MKKVKFMTALLTALLLCGCSGYTDEPSGTADAVLQTEPDTETETASETETEAVTEKASVERSYTSYEVSPEEKTEIQSFLTEFKKFAHDYLDCKIYYADENLDVIDRLQHITAGENGSMEYYRAVGGDYLTYSSLMAAIDRYCSEEVAGECNLKGYSYWAGENDELYIWKDADSNGSVMGSDAAYIESAEISEDSGYIKLNMTAWGDGEEWGYPDNEDSYEPFSIVLKRENDSFKLEECGLMEFSYLEWLYSPELDKI